MELSSSKKKDSYITQLTDRAETMYKQPRWKKVIQSKGNRGRDTLYSFMRHWISSQIQKSMGITLPQDFALGKPF